MAEYAISLGSNVDTFERVRQALSGLVFGTAGLQSRSGIFDRGGVVTLAGGMSVLVSPFRGYVDGTSSALQAGYFVVLDTAKALTFADGGASNRTDIIAGRIRDNTYDASGATSFTVEIVQGVPGGGVPATPANSFKIAEKVITAGMSAGSGGLGTAPTDKRPPRLVAAGGIIPVTDGTDRNTLPAWAGLAVFRLDTLRTEYYDGSAWNAVAPILEYAKASKAGTQNIADSTAVQVTLSAVVKSNPASFVDLPNNRLLVPKTGSYDVTAQVRFSAATGGQRAVRIIINGQATAGNGGPGGAASDSGAHFVSVFADRLQLTAGDLITFEAFQNTGSGLATSSAPDGTYLAARRCVE